MIYFVFAVDVERIDTWVLRLGIAVPLVCVAWLVLWHLVPYLVRKKAKTRQPARLSPEPLHPPAQIKSNDPEQLQQACAALEESLAEKYLELANCWVREGQSHQAADVLQKIVQNCAETRQAKVARERLERLAAEKNHS